MPTLPMLADVRKEREVCHTLYARYLLPCRETFQEMLSWMMSVVYPETTHY